MASRGGRRLLGASMVVGAALLLAALMILSPALDPTPGQLPANNRRRRSDAVRQVLVVGADHLANAVALALTQDGHTVAVLAKVPRSGLHTLDTPVSYERLYALDSAGAHVAAAGLCDTVTVSRLFGEWQFSELLIFVEPHWTGSELACLASDLLARAAHVPNVLVVVPAVLNPHVWTSPTVHTMADMAERRWLYDSVLRLARVFAQEHCNNVTVSLLPISSSVYGPHADEGSFLFQWACAIVSNVPVTMYDQATTGGRHPVIYVDNAVAWVLATLGAELSGFDAPIAACLRLAPMPSTYIYTTDMLGLLERELGNTARLELVPIPAKTQQWQHPIPVQFTAQRPLSSTPPTPAPVVLPIELGVRRFARWFARRLEMAAQHADDTKQKWAVQHEYATEELMSPAQQLLLELGRYGQQQRYGQQLRHQQQRNNITRAWLIEQRQEWQQRTGNTVYPRVKEFEFFASRDAPGGDLYVAEGASVAELQAQCQALPYCLGFNTYGFVKSVIAPEKEWTAVGRPGAGIYVVRNMDVCQVGQTGCDKHATCLSHGRHQYTCTCQRGFAGSPMDCTPQLGYQVEDPLDALDAPHLGSRPPFVFFPGMDSPFGDLLTVNGNRSVAHLRELCWAMPRCVAFNTNGILKLDVQDVAAWYRWTSDLHRGLYVMDVNYCYLRGEKCPVGAACTRVSAARYECRCKEPGHRVSGVVRPLLFSMSNETETVQVCVPAAATLPLPPKVADTIHVVFSVDSQQLVGLCAVLRSILHAASPATLQRLVVYVVYPQHMVVPMDWGLPSTLLLRWIAFDPIALLGGEEVVVHSDSSIVGNLASPANFARLFLDTLLPDLDDRLLFVDVDVIVQRDIAELWDNVALSDGQLLAAVLRTAPTYGNFFGKATQDLYEHKYGHKLDLAQPTFNAGIYLLNLALWRRKRCSADSRFWMKQNKAHRLWTFGTQPILLLLAYQRWGELDTRWNVNGLGWRTDLTSADLDQAFALHWSGKSKPWEAASSLSQYQRYWQRHACSHPLLSTQSLEKSPAYLDIDNGLQYSLVFLGLTDLAEGIVAAIQAVLQHASQPPQELWLLAFKEHTAAFQRLMACHTFSAGPRKTLRLRMLEVPADIHSLSLALLQLPWLLPKTERAIIVRPDALVQLDVVRLLKQPLLRRERLVGVIPFQPRLMAGQVFSKAAVAALGLTLPINQRLPFPSSACFVINPVELRRDPATVAEGKVWLARHQQRSLWNLRHEPLALLFLAAKGRLAYVPVDFVQKSRHQHPFAALIEADDPKPWLGELRSLWDSYRHPECHGCAVVAGAYACQVL